MVMNWLCLPRNPWRRAATVMVMVALAACGTDTGFANKQQHVAETTTQQASAPMPEDLRAAHIASVQREAPEAYAALSLGDWVRLHNPAQRFVSTIDARGLALSPDDGDWHLEIRTRAVGCESNMIPLAEAVPKAMGNRVDLHREGSSEWYLNGPLGVEQGFVIAEAPACAGPKRIALAIEGSLTAALDDSDGDGRGEAVRFVDAHGQATVSYTDLFVTDALGKTVPAWLSVNCGEITIVVDDAQATYPLAIDPLVWLEQAKLTASDGAEYDFFGMSVSLSGDTALVGADSSTVGGQVHQGSAYVFVRNGPTWTEQAKLVASDGAISDFFGCSVALDVDTALVGACRDYAGPNANGSVYVFVRSGTTWTQQQRLVRSDGGWDEAFGYSLSLSGDTALVGAYLDDIGNGKQGSAYVFVRNGTTWTEQAKLIASDGTAGDEFGQSVSIAGDTVLVGSPFSDIGSNTNEGAAYVFMRSGTTWTEQEKLVPSDGAAFDLFGQSVALAGDMALVGANWHDLKAGMDTNEGSAYVFVRNGMTWAEQAKLVASDGAPKDHFGVAVSLSADTALVAARNNEDSAYVFVRNGTTWTEQQKLLASDGSVDGAFGTSVSLSGHTAVVGDGFGDVGANLNQGSAYVFVLGKANGDACTEALECASGFCVDGVCCNLACGNGDVADCQACSMTAGGMSDGMCSPLTMGTVCRSAADICDAPESCDGTAMDCPADAKAPDGTTCPEGTCTSGMCEARGGMGGSGGGGHGGSAGQGEASSSSGGGKEMDDEGGCDCRMGKSTNGSSLFTIATAALVAALARRRRNARG